VRDRRIRLVQLGTAASTRGKLVADADFARFAALRWRHPLQPSA
jgi:hypothetical protein